MSGSALLVSAARPAATPSAVAPTLSLMSHVSSSVLTIRISLRCIRRRARQCRRNLIIPTNYYQRQSDDAPHGGDAAGSGARLPVGRPVDDEDRVWAFIESSFAATDS